MPLYRDISEYFKHQNSSATTLHSVLGDLVGGACMNHMVMPFDFPTWSMLPIAPESKDSVSTEIFARDNNFLVEEQDYANNITLPTANLLTNYYTVRAGPFDPAQNPRQRLEYTSGALDRPSTDVVCPYSVADHAGTYTLILGILIQHEEITGFVIPIECPQDNSITTENNFYLQSAIPIERTIPLFVTTAPDANSITIYRRDRMNPLLQTTISVSYTYGEVTFPQRAAQQGRELEADVSRYGLTRRSNYQKLELGFNIRGGTATEQQTVLNYPVWSSFRSVSGGAVLSRTISVLASLRPIYGTNVLLQRIPHPTMNLPSI